MLKKLEAAVRAASKIMLRPGGLTVRGKGAFNPVTERDVAVQEFLQGELKKICPEAGFAAEEGGAMAENRGLRFIVDPIDGTTNYINGLAHSAVSVALCEGEETLAAVVFDPYRNELFAAERGAGARQNGEKISVSSREYSESLIFFGTTPYDRSAADLTFGILKAAYVSSRDVRRSGSAALDLAWVAAGRADGFFEASLSPWDYAAGRLLVAEAGGRVTNFAGGPVSLASADSVVAGGARVYEVLMGIIAAELERRAKE